MKDKIAIRPTSGVYATYKRLSYQPWTAIAEFVDNSTQSYFDHRDELRSLAGFEKLHISVIYESKNGGNDSLTITDNAFGMEIDDFERAIQLDKVPPNTGGRNEFGMGLKTAACWFGGKWSVNSTQLGSEYGYSCTVDVDRLAISKDDYVDMDIFQSSPEEHYTTIKIENLNKKITGPRTIGKVRDLLSSIYRQDIRTGEISIIYGENELTYKDPEIYKEELENGESRIWCKDINFSIPHEGMELDCHGFIALRIPASLHDAGFTLLRRGRVIIGGPDKNYRPRELFGDQNSFEYQRLFGELHMDNWPVTQAKDDFDWHNSGLEEAFITAMQPLVKEYRNKAANIRVRQKANTEQVINDAVNALESGGIISNPSPIAIPNPITIPANEPATKDVSSIEIEETTTVDDVGVKLEGSNNYDLKFLYKDKDYLFNINFDSSNSQSQWVNVARKDSAHYQITINLKHEFFKPFTENKDFMALMTKFVLAMVLAEIDARVISNDGKVDAADIRRNMNSILVQMASGGIV